MLIRETAERLARYRWAERRLFELAGGWSADGGDAEVASLLGAVAQHAGWRAGQWDVLAPVLHDVDEASLAPPSGAVAALDEVAGASSPLERLAVLDQVVLPALDAWYEDHAGLVADVADGPVARMLRLVRVDVQGDWRATKVLLRSRLLGEGDLVLAAARQSALARLLLTTEG